MKVFLKLSPLVKQHLSYLIVFVLLSFIVFFPSLFGAPFWDDWVFIFKKINNEMFSVSPLIFFKPGVESKSWPVFFAVLWGLFKIFKFNYFYYHLVSIVFHALDGFLCWLILQKLNIRNSFLLTLLFLFHPFQLYTVAWIIQLKTILSIFFFLISILFLMNFYKENKFCNYILCLIFFSLSLLTKSTTAAFAACLIFSYPLLNSKFSFKKYFILIILPFTLLATASTIRTAWSFNVKEYLKSEKVENKKVITYDNQAQFHKIESLEKTILTGKLFIRYLLFTAVPLNSIRFFQEKTNITFSSLEFFGIFIGLSAFYFLLQMLITKKLYLELFGVMFFTATLLPFCGIFDIPIFSVSNFIPYWLSIPFLGLLPLISYFIKSKKILIVFILLLSGITHYHSYRFMSVESLISDIKTQSPELGISKIMLIEQYAFTGQCEKANNLFHEFKNTIVSLQHNLEFKVNACVASPERLKR